MVKRGIGKKSALVLLAIFEVVMFALFIIIMINVGRSYGNQKAIFKLSVAKDIAILIDSLYTTPGDVLLTYPAKITGYDAEIDGNNVIVFEGDKNLEGTAKGYGFVGMAGGNVNGTAKNADYLILRKKGGDIELDSGKNAK